MHNNQSLNLLWLYEQFPILKKIGFIKIYVFIMKNIVIFQS